MADGKVMSGKKHTEESKQSNPSGKKLPVEGPKRKPKKKFIIKSKSTD